MAETSFAFILCLVSVLEGQTELYIALADTVTVNYY